MSELPMPRTPARRLCVLMTSFNRRDRTLACLEALERSEGLDDVQLDAVLVDDASTDGTAEAVRDRFPWVHVIESEGDLYWCRGMHRAFRHARARGYDLHLWLNDDTLPDTDALARLLACHDALRRRLGRPILVSGSTRGIDGHLTYGGERRDTGWRRLRLRLVEPTSEPQRVDTFNGNMVLVSEEAAAVVGNLDPTFEHAMGDTDYGLRAGLRGVETWLAPGTHGVCEQNPIDGTFLDTTLPLRRRWHLMQSRKGLPLRSWWRMTRRHGGALWPALLLWPYVRLLATGAAHRRGAPEQLEKA